MLPTGSRLRYLILCRLDKNCAKRAHEGYMADLTLKPGRGSCVGRTLLEAKIVQIPDIRRGGRLIG
jgi:hypothetical protein